MRERDNGMKQKTRKRVRLIKSSMYKTWKRWHKYNSKRDFSADEAEVIVHERSDGENVVGVNASSHDF